MYKLKVFTGNEEELLKLNFTRVLDVSPESDFVSSHSLFYITARAFTVNFCFKSW